MNLLKNIKLVDALFVLLIVAVIFGIEQTCNLHKKINDNAGIERIKDIPVTHYKDDNGIDHAEKPVAEADADAINAHYNHIIDSLTKVINTKPKNIVSVTSLGSETKDMIHPTITYKKVDTCVSVLADSVEYQDNWIKLKGSISNKEFTYNIRDSIALVTYYKRTGFLKKDLYANVFSTNPNTTISGITSLHLSQAKPMKFGIGLQAGYSWNDGAFKPTIGVGISYNIIRF